MMKEYKMYLRDLFENPFVNIAALSGAGIGGLRYFTETPQAGRDTNGLVALIAGIYLLGLGVYLYKKSRQSNNETRE